MREARHGLQDSGSTSDAPLRLRLADLVLDIARLADRADGEAFAGIALSPLERFLQQPSGGAALAEWLGGEEHAQLRGEPRRLKALLDRDIARIDELVAAQVNAILHAERFQMLEASWRGVDYLVRVADGAAGVKLRILSVTWQELVRDFERAADFDQSEAFDKIYSQEFGMPGGEPYGIIVGDYFVSHRRTPKHPTDDVAALKSLAAVAAAAFVPIVVGCAPSILGLESFRDLSAELDLDAIFQQAEYMRWRGLREVEDGRFIGLCLPRILMRRPWDDRPGHRAPSLFREKREAPADNGYLWGNAAYAFAAVAIRAFVQSGWFAEIRGTRRGESAGGLVDNLPVDTFTTDRPEIAFKFPTEVAIPDRQEKLLGDLGFIPLSVAEYTPYAVFYSNQSLHAPQRYSTAVATINARLSSMLQYMLCIGRFAHAIKVIGRDQVGSFSTAEECERKMQRWLTDYVTANANASVELRTKFPLREGRVSVSELPGRPGIFKMDMYLRPHLQLDDISTAIRLTTELAAPRAA
jgi:type VI secretion system protein ImpD